MTPRLRIRFATALFVLVSTSGCLAPVNQQIEPAEKFVAPDIDFELIAADVDPPNIQWTDDVDFGKLREHYGRRKDFSSRCEYAPERNEAAEAVGAGNSDLILELTDSLLARCPVDPILHHWRSRALDQLGLPEDAETHRRWVQGLFDSILSTGDGKTTKTPFITISIYEEYQVLSFLGLTKKKQSLIDSPVALDMIVAEREDGSEVTVYFNPLLHFIRLYESLDQMTPAP
ncbi:MAG: DUF4919 domain-containing protein [Myxococcota bacterium]